MLRYVLPDGRAVLVERLSSDDHWHLQLEGEGAEEIVGEPLQSTLAELLGFDVVHESWPSWVDDCAVEIERSFWRHS